MNTDLYATIDSEGFRYAFSYGCFWLVLVIMHDAKWHHQEYLANILKKYIVMLLYRLHKNMLLFSCYISYYVPLANEEDSCPDGVVTGEAIGGYCQFHPDQ